MTGRLWFVVESGTDVRLVDGLAARFALTVLARRIEGGVEISQPPAQPVDLRVGPASRSAFARRVFQDLSRLGPADRVLAQGYGPAALAASWAARRSGAPTSLLVCSPVERYYAQRRAHPEPGKGYSRLAAAGIALVARATARLARRYIVLSRHLAEVVRAHGTRAAIDVVPVYGVDTAVFRPAGETRERIRQRLGLPVGDTLLFFSSRVAPEKDAETLLAALRDLPDTVRLLHRSGGYRQFAALAGRCGVEHRVLAADAVHPIKELPFYYQAADVVVQASREEGLGFAPLEALACEVPVVAARVGGLTETIVEGETGWTYPVGDAAGLAAALRAATADPAEGRRRAARGRARVAAEFEHAVVFQRLEDILRGGNGP